MHLNWWVEAMDKTNEIIKLLGNITIPEEGFSLKKHNNFYWGKGPNGEIVYAFEAINKCLQPLSQVTKYLTLYLNTIFDVEEEGIKRKLALSMIVLKCNEKNYINIFIRLTQSITCNLNEENLLNYFLNLKDLFSNSRKVSDLELQGLYGELFTMYFLKINYNVDISTYYQSEDKRKFDFSITERKKIEIKTTIKAERVHHFLQEQLNTQRYDIKIVSLMLQKDDKGLSLLELIIKCKNIFSSNLSVLLHIEKTIKNIDDIQLENVKFNYDYSKGKFKIYDALNIPRLKEKTEEGVFNVQFDSDISTSQATDIDYFISWLNS